ncbi:MAG TPA: response regulator transcription factor [Terriglobales bacterium]|nr:response regulator transcription factor [Terriglobales bacterium]
MWILVVENETSMGELLRQGLEEQNHAVTLAKDGVEGFHAAKTSNFDAIVLDVMMPGMDGIEVARRLRADGQQTPIIMLTARDAAADIVKGLDAGADDYLTKPFSLKVLLARLRAISRRAAQPPQQNLHIDDLVVDPAAREVTRAGQKISLTATEFRVLEFLLRRAGRAVSRSAIIEAVWGFEEDVEPNTVDAFIKLLRDKIDAGSQRKLIHTVRGYGYILREGE